MGQDLNKIENQCDAVAKEYADTFAGEHEKKPKDQEILHSSCLKNSGFEKIDMIEREPYPGVEYESRGAYVFAKNQVDN